MHLHNVEAEVLAVAEVRVRTPCHVRVEVVRLVAHVSQRHTRRVHPHVRVHPVAVELQVATLSAERE